MKLGAFSISLSVKDLAKSKAFYETIGFTKFHGEESENWLIMKNGDTVIGLFQGMFEGNLMTFNPGWDGAAQEFDPFDDVRDIQRQLESAGFESGSQIASDQGPASFMVQDPDGNTIMFDQHR